jgi:hypothetical protein
MTKEGNTKRKSTQERNQIRNKEEREDLDGELHEHALLGTNWALKVPHPISISPWIIILKIPKEKT